MDAVDAVAAWRERAADAVLLDGFHAVKHALRFGAAVEPVLAADRAAALALAESLAPDLVDRLAASIVQVPAETIAALTGQPAHPTAVAALAVRPQEWDVLPAGAPVVVLDRPRHAGNLGAAVRVAAGLGAAGVLSTGTLDPWHPTVVRGSAGLHFALPVRRVAEEEVVAAAGPVLAFDAGGTDLRRTAIPDGALLVFGSERAGVGAALRARADQVLALPMRPLVSSYNLATSVAMALYHWSLGTG
jgi:RNA methyltransferase, TrmH family